jgi:hypothetical protein
MVAMGIPESSRKEVEAMPAILRALLEAELAAGNEITEVGHTFPAPPVGAYFKLAKPLLTRARKSGDGIVYYGRRGSSYSGEISDNKRFFFLLEPADAPEPEPDMDVLRAPHLPVVQPVVSDLLANVSPKTAGETPLLRFERSMVLDFDKWHDGVGYDLDALRAMSPAEKTSAEAMLIRRGARDWRDIEALACLDTPAARAAIKAAMNNPNPEVRNAITRCAPGLVPESLRTASLVRGLETANFYGGLTQTLDQVAGFHPPLIVDALLRGALGRAGEVAVHFAAMLCYIHGRAQEPFDWEQRPFFLRFNTDNRLEREAAFLELCQKIGVETARYLAKGKSAPVPPANTKVPPPDYTVEVDCRGEMLTYCELNRSAHVICTFGGTPCIVSRTLSNWFYPVGRRSEKMGAEEKEIILGRIADYCLKHHRMPNVTFET